MYVSNRSTATSNSHRNIENIYNEYNWVWVVSTIYQFG